MQNKSRILKHNGFALIAAVFLMLFISILLLKMLSYSTDTSARTTNQYLYEQAVLLAYNATEYAMLQISEDDRSAGCTSAINTVYPSSGPTMFNINVSVQYSWESTTAPTTTGCTNTPFIASGINVVTPEQNGTAIIDVIVSSNSSLNLDEPIRFHRRTLQKL